MGFQPEARSVALDLIEDSSSRRTSELSGLPYAAQDDSRYPTTGIPNHEISCDETETPLG